MKTQLLRYTIKRVICQSRYFKITIVIEGQFKLDVQHDKQLSHSYNFNFIRMI